MLEGLRGEESIAALCWCEGIAESLYYNWSKESWKPARSGWRATGPVPPCVYRKLNTGVAVMRSAQNDTCPYHTGSLNRASIPRRCASPRTMMWSTHSRRIDPISRSAKPFCQGDAGVIGLSRMPMARNRRVTTAP